MPALLDDVMSQNELTIDVPGNFDSNCLRQTVCLQFLVTLLLSQKDKLVGLNTGHVHLSAILIMLE